jgi:uncharacterized protein (TIGR04255 family)
MSHNTTDASSSETSNRLPLSQAPLVRVLCQVRWPNLTKFDPKAVSGDMAEMIGDSYPFSSVEQESLFTIGQSGVSQQPGGTLYRFESIDRTWALTLGDVFLALETSSYSGHQDFLARLGDAVDALRKAARIPTLLRIGYRYTNRLDQPKDIQNLGSYFAPSILGGLAQGDSSKVVRTITETILKEDDSYLVVRSALLEPGALIDPTLKPVTTQSWIVDLDSYIESSVGLPIESVRQEAERLARRASQHLFRSLVGPGFEERFR